MILINLSFLSSLGCGERILVVNPKNSLEDQNFYLPQVNSAFSKHRRSSLGNAYRGIALTS